MKRLNILLSPRDYGYIIDYLWKRQFEADNCSLVCAKYWNELLTKIGNATTDIKERDNESKTD